MQKYLCKIGFHSYRTVEMTDCFTTKYTDTNLGPIKHIVWYQICRCCGKRRVKDTYKKDTIGGTRHAGIEYARVAWVEYAQIYLGEGQVKKFAVNQTAPINSKPKFTVVDGDKK
jgi:hypothetical protein